MFTALLIATEAGARDATSDYGVPGSIWPDHALNTTKPSPSERKKTPGKWPGASFTFQRGTAEATDCDLGGCSNQLPTARSQYVDTGIVAQRDDPHDSHVALASLCPAEQSRAASACGYCPQ